MKIGTIVFATGILIATSIFGFSEFVDRLFGLGPAGKVSLHTSIELTVGEDPKVVLAAGVIQEEVVLLRPGKVSTYLANGEALVVKLPSNDFAFILPVAGANGGAGRALPVMAEACGNRPPFTYDTSSFDNLYLDWFASLDSTSACTVESGFPILVLAPGTDDFEWITLKSLGQRLGYQDEMLRLSISLTEELPTAKNRALIERVFESVEEFNLSSVNPDNGREYPISKQDFLSDR